MSEFFRLLAGTVIHRPYVYAFFACFLVFAVAHIGAKRTAAYTVMAWIIAFISEYSATRNGFPFGLYHYIDETRTRELWVSNVPFWDSLSFVFLSYFSFLMAAALLSRPGELRGGAARWSGLAHPWAPLLGAFLMMMLDVVIDPVTLRGEKWFLGRMYYYPTPGPHFGVTWQNYVGWFFVGAVTQFLGQHFLVKPSRSRLPRLFPWAVWGVYAGVLGFMIFIAAVFVKEPALFAASVLTALATLGPMALRLSRVAGWPL